MPPIRGIAPGATTYSAVISDPTSRFVRALDLAPLIAAQWNSQAHSPAERTRRAREALQRACVLPALLAAELQSLPGDAATQLLDLRLLVAAADFREYLGRLDSVLLAAAGAGLLAEAETRFAVLMGRNLAETAVLLLENWYERVARGAS